MNKPVHNKRSVNQLHLILTACIYLVFSFSSSQALAVSSCGGLGERACCGGELLDNTNPHGLACEGSRYTALSNLVEMAGDVPSPATCGGVNLFGVQSNGRCETCGTEGVTKCKGIYTDHTEAGDIVRVVNVGTECGEGLRADLFGICSSCGGDGQPVCLDPVENLMCNEGYHPSFGFCAADLVVEEPDCDCDPILEIKNPKGPVRGYADLHLHMFGNLAFGGMTVWGDAFNKTGGISQALRADNYAQRTADQVINGHVRQGIFDETVPIDALRGQQLVHGDRHANDLIGAGTGQHFPGKLNNGGVNWEHSITDDFVAWPKWNSTTHQQAYYKWLERAHRGGLQLTVMLAVDNESMCVSGRHLDIEHYECETSDGTLKLQIAKAHELEAWLTSECVSGKADACATPDSREGWFKVVTSPKAAREAIAKGQLAVVLGIEEANLFDCNSGDCTKAHIEEQIDIFHALGVRHIFPIHNFDNDYGGAATWMDTIGVGNRYATGNWYSTEDCIATNSSFDGADANYGFRLGDEGGGVLSLTDWLSQLILGVHDAYPLDYKDRVTSCNTVGLKPRGQELIDAMMNKGMIIDIDHMSVKAIESTLSSAETWKSDTGYPTFEEGYPGIVASHVLMFDLTQEDYRHERMRTADQLKRIADLGGMIAVMTQPPEGGGDGAGAERTIQEWSGSKINNDCQASSKTFAQAYEWAVKEMNRPVAFGTDFNGISRHNAPRFGISACDNQSASAYQDDSTKMSYPFTIEGFGTFETQKTSTREFNYNTDGLAHIGMLPDFIEDLKMVGLTDADLEPLFQSAEAYIAMWEGANKAAGRDAGTGLTPEEFDALYDTTPPSVLPPFAITVQSSALLTKATGLGNTFAFDKVDGVLIAEHDWNFEGNLPAGEYTVNWKATDTTGNVGRATQKITVLYAVNEVVAPADVVVEATGLFTAANLGSAFMTADINGNANYVNIIPNKFGPFLLGHHEVTWTAISIVTGFPVGSAIQIVTIEDTTKPVVTAPPSLTVEATALRSRVDLGEGSATDLIDQDVNVYPVVPGPFSVGAFNIPWEGKDASGNIGRDSQSLTVTDTTAPVITAPSDVVAEATGVLTDVAIGTATATDLVDGNIVPSKDVSSPFSIGSHTVIWRATDTRGNTSTVSQNVLIVDSAPPVVTAPFDITIEATGSMTTVELGIASAEDFVDGILLATPDKLGPFPVGDTLVTWTATDASGNVGATTQVVSVVDTTAPNVIAPENFTIEASAVLTPVSLGLATATDIVDGALFPSADMNGPFSLGVNSITWSVTDNANNLGSAQQVISVVDTTSPVLIVPANLTVEATGILSAIVIGEASATDVFSSTVTSDQPANFPLGETTVTWVATDINGNASSAVQVVTVIDTTAPLVAAPSDITVIATGSLTEVDLGLANAEDAVVIIGGSNVDNEGPFGLGETIVNWSASDSTNNIGIAQQSVNVLGEFACQFKQATEGKKKKKGKPAEFYLKSFNVDENQSALWLTLFNKQAEKAKRISLLSQRQLVWQAGSASIEGKLRLETKKKKSGLTLVTIAEFDDESVLQLSAASGSVNPELSSGAKQNVKIKGLDGVRITIDGITITGRAKLLKINVENSNLASIKKFELKLLVDSAQLAALPSRPLSISLDVPETAVNLAALVDFKVTRKGNKRSGHVKASLIDANESSIDANESSVEILGAENLLARSGACVIDLKPSQSSQ